MIIRDRITELRRVKASELRPHPANWRTHPKAQQDALRGVLAEIGYADALLCRELPDGSLEILDGHLRAETTPDSVVPVLITDLDDAEARALLLTHDPLGAMAEANHEALIKLMSQIETQSDGVQDMLDALAAEHGVEPETAEQAEPPEAELDRASELQAEWKTEPGQLWEIPGKAGSHRLLCGDSTARASWRKCNLVVTSPPYPAAAMWNEDQEHSVTDNIPRLYKLGDAVYTMCKEFADVTCWNVADVPKGGARQEWVHVHYIQLAESSGDLVRTILWRKGITNPLPPISFMRRPCVPHLSHEYILVCYHDGRTCREARHGLEGEDHTHQMDSVWSIAPASAKAIGHKCPFPVEVALRCCRLFSIEGDLICDPFLGSGTTMVAAEQLGRVCCGIEIEPTYVAVALQRMKDMGLAPILEVGPSV